MRNTSRGGGMCVSYRSQAPEGSAAEPSGNTLKGFNAFCLEGKAWIWA